MSQLDQGMAYVKRRLSFVSFDFLSLLSKQDCAKIPCLWDPNHTHGTTLPPSPGPHRPPAVCMHAQRIFIIIFSSWLWRLPDSENEYWCSFFADYRWDLPTGVLILLHPFLTISIVLCNNNDRSSVYRHVDVSLALLPVSILHNCLASPPFFF